MLELRKMNFEDIKEQWEYVTALPADENGLTNPYEGVSFDEYRDSILPELMMYEKPINMPAWFVPETYYYLWADGVLVGDKHIDIYWVLWSLNYNLKTDKYTDYFLDLYGRENVDMNVLKLVAEVENL